MHEFCIIAGAILISFASSNTVTLCRTNVWTGTIGIRDFHYGQVTGMMLICIGLLI